MKNHFMNAPMSLIAVGFALVLADAARADGPVEAPWPSDRIGESLGKPVFRHQIREEFSLRSELSRLFTAPIWRKYRAKLEEEIELTPAEIKAAIRYFEDRAEKEPEQFGETWKRIIARERARADKLLQQANDKFQKKGLSEAERERWEKQRELAGKMKKAPGTFFVVWIFGRQKFQQHLYRKYGGGRVLWQQVGLEAFDAMHRWLKEQEDSGKFRIDDPHLRDVFYEYWTSQEDRTTFVGDSKKDEFRPELLAFPWDKDSSEENE